MCMLQVLKKNHWDLGGFPMRSTRTPMHSTFRAARGWFDLPEKEIAMLLWGASWSVANHRRIRELDVRAAGMVYNLRQREAIENLNLRAHELHSAGIQLYPAPNRWSNELVCITCHGARVWAADSSSWLARGHRVGWRGIRPRVVTATKSLVVHFCSPEVVHLGCQEQESTTICTYIYNYN